MTETPTLTQALASLGLNPPQILELEADEERAWGWVIWLREQTGVTNPAGLLLTKYRSEQEPPDPNAWRGDEPKSKGPDYRTLLRCAENLVAATGHEYLEEDLAEELERLGRLPKVGSGATLTGKDRARLLRQAAAMRQRQEAALAERDEADAQFTIDHYLRALKERRLTTKHLAQTVIPRIRQAGKEHVADVLAEAVERIAQAQLEADEEKQTQEAAA